MTSTLEDPDDKRFALYVLGAGFSHPAGLPLGSELWKEVLHRALPMTGRAAKFRRDLDNFIEFKKRCDGIDLTYETLDFEEFLGFLDIEHFLGLRGSDTWSDDGNEGQIIVKTLIGEILTERTPTTNEIPELYVNFARKLRPDDVVITFNYDVLLERSLEAASVAYRLFPDRYKSVGQFSGVVDSDDEEVVILKMHGSVDWFDRQRFIDHQDAGRSSGYDSYVPHHSIFNSSRNLNLSPVVDGPRFPNDPLKEMYRVIDVERFYNQPDWFLATPSLISPSRSKLVYSRQFHDFWHGLGHAGAANFQMAIIGYSLPDHDDYARQMIFGLVDNYQNIPAERVSITIKEKSPLLVVDFQRSESDVKRFKDRYSFVDWTTAVLRVDGFNDDVLALI